MAFRRRWKPFILRDDMRAILFEQFGEPADVLRLHDIPVPQPAVGELRVRMLASPINPSDLMTVRGCYGKLPELPAAPGYEGVGIVEASGGGLLGKLLIGKRVALLSGAGGGWSEQTVVPAKQVVPLGSNVPLEQAAMFFVNPTTAVVMTEKVLRVSQAAWLLQTAAGSALGRMVIRLGKQNGFRTLNVVRREEQADQLRRLGGDAVVCFDPHRHDALQLTDDVQQITGNQGVPFAIDPVGGRTGSAVVDCLAAGGRMLVFGSLSDDPLSFSPRSLMTPGTSIQGFWLARWMQQQRLLVKLRLVRRVARLMRAGILVSEVGETFPLEQIADAVRTAEQPARGGKVLLRISDA